MAGKKSGSGKKRKKRKNRDKEPKDASGKSNKHKSFHEKKKIHSENMKILDKHGRNKEFFKVCPECGSIDVHENLENPLSPIGLPALYTCRRCMHTSNIFPEARPEKIKKLKEHIIDDIRLTMIDESEKVDISYGRFEVNFMWKFTGPLLVFAGILLILNYPVNYINLMVPALLIVIGIFMIYITYLGGRR